MKIWIKFLLNLFCLVSIIQSNLYLKCIMSLYMLSWFFTLQLLYSVVTVKACNKIRLKFALRRYSISTKFCCFKSFIFFPMEIWENPMIWIMNTDFPDFKKSIKCFWHIKQSQNQHWPEYYDNLSDWSIVPTEAFSCFVDNKVESE